jgi:hypothetical protein
MIFTLCGGIKLRRLPEERATLQAASTLIVRSDATHIHEQVMCKPCILVTQNGKRATTRGLKLTEPEGPGNRLCAVWCNVFSARGRCECDARYGLIRANAAACASIKHTLTGPGDRAPENQEY